MAKTVVRQTQVDPDVATEAEVAADIRAAIGAPNGAAPLDASSIVPLVNLPKEALAAYTLSQLVLDGGDF